MPSQNGSSSTKTETPVGVDYFKILGWRINNPDDQKTDEEILAHYAQVNQRCAESSLSSPLYRARAERDPEFFSKFSSGAAR